MDEKFEDQILGEYQQHEEEEPGSTRDKQLLLLEKSPMCSEMWVLYSQDMRGEKTIGLELNISMEMMKKTPSNGSKLSNEQLT